jgi:uncharacterized protein YbjT (DUF2867 family)
MGYRRRMRILLLGATGLIGSAIAARLRRDGVTVVAVARGGGSAVRRLGLDQVVKLDLRNATRPEHWRDALDGVDAVINAAGLLQDGAATQIVQQAAPAALYLACAAAGVRRIVHISAIGADRPVTLFSRSKQEIEATLSASDLDWVVLRPAVVVGRAAYGGSALLRGLAALPLLPVPRRSGRVQIVQLDDVAETAARMVRPDAPVRIVLDLAAPEALGFDEAVARYRSWLGWRPARTVPTPDWLMAAAYALGDLAGLLGWRPPIRTTTRLELERGAVGDPSDWIRLTGIAPRTLADALAAEPASVQERWFARLFLLKPAVFVTLGLFWIATGLISLGPGRALAEAMMREAGGGALSGALVVGGALADLAIGVFILVRRTSKPALLAALALSIAYLATGTLLQPALWADPLGPLMKILPILVLNLVALAILEDR